MIVKNTWAGSIIIFGLICSRSCKMLGEPVTSTESSSEYLRAVMLELRDMNLPISPISEQSTGSRYFDVDDRNYLAGKRHYGGKKVVQQFSSNHDDLAFRGSMLQSVMKKIQPVDQMISETAMNPNNIYYQVPEDILTSLPKPPEVSEHPIEKGSLVSLDALANVLRHRQLPKVTTNQMKVGGAQPMYSYYFYPLKTFANDAHGHDLLPAMINEIHHNLRPEKTGLMEDTQKNMGNPLFVAISGFIGMAVLFMIGVLLYPRLGDFTSRVESDDKFLQLTKTVGEAIDRHNCTENQAPYMRLDKRLQILCQPVNTPKPSSVVLLTRKSQLQKEAKRRRKIPKKCKIPPCKKNLERNGPT